LTSTGGLDDELEQALDGALWPAWGDVVSQDHLPVGGQLGQVAVEVGELALDDLRSDHQP
jgi:hypothetical protein